LGLRLRSSTSPTATSAASRAPQAGRAEQVQQRQVALALPCAAVRHPQQPLVLLVRERARLAASDRRRL
jgi:hypothetical protein